MKGLANIFAERSRWLRLLSCLWLLLVLGACAVEPPEESVAEPSATGEPGAEEAAAALEYREWETVPPGEYSEYNQRANLIQRGHRVYSRYCVGCHGEYGDGVGPASPRLITQPRDFTSGIYKFRSTDSGSLPLEEDLYRTVTRGLARVSMPAFPLLPENDKIAVIEYIKAFYPRWEEEKDRRRVVPIPRAPEDLGDDVRRLRGQAVYLQTGCWKCHGTDGRGEGATQTEYVDAWGHPQRPFDFTRGALKGGNSPEDIYRTFHTGLRSIMPSFAGDTLAAVTAGGFDLGDVELPAAEQQVLDTVRDEFPADAEAIFGTMEDAERLELAERNSWDLVAYILSLRRSTSTAPAVLGPMASRTPLEQTAELNMQRPTQTRGETKR